MMKKINHQSHQSIENGRLQCLAIKASSANESDSFDVEDRRLLAGGSIDYAYYDKKARVIRSTATHKFLSFLLTAVKSWPG